VKKAMEKEHVKCVKKRVETMEHVRQECVNLKEKRRTQRERENF
jgi:hypothetical protein